MTIYSIYTFCPLMNSFFLSPHERSTLSHFPLSSSNLFLSCEEVFVLDLEKEKDPLCVKLSYSLGNEYSLAKMQEIILLNCLTGSYMN